MDKKKLLFCMLFLAVFLLGTRNNSVILSGTPNNTLTFGEIKGNNIPLSSANETIFGTPDIDPSNPSSFDDVHAACSIYDPDGMKNATLFWKYTTINNTEYNTTMTGGVTPVVNVTAFGRTGRLTASGDETPSNTNWRFGEFTYEEQVGHMISQIDVSIDTNVTQTLLVYVLIQAKNLTTGLWENRYVNGTIGGTINVSPRPAIYSSTELTAGYHIYAISYRGGPTDPLVPIFNYLEIYNTDFQGTIVAIDQPTWVDYYIKTFDQSDNEAVSETYSFLMDSPPTVQFNDLPTVIADSGTLNLNVTVTDADGWENIGVTAYYHIETPTIWSSSSLTFSANISSTAAYYTGSIPIPDLSNVERDLTLYVNASDIVGGIIAYKGTTGEETILIDGQNPLVENIVVEGGDTGVENVVLITSNVTITADFIDPSGIEEVFIYYAIPNGTTFIKQAMVNLTSSEPNETPVSYTTILPSANKTAYVEFKFEALDYLGNKGTSSSSFYYADGAAPKLSALRLYPNLISEDTEVNVLFNATDPSDLEDSVLWYQLTGESWHNVIITQEINYNLLIDYQETYTADDLPVLIQDKNTTTIDLEVKRHNKVDSASVTVDLIHENAADLRIWLKSGDKRVLLYDRMPNILSFTFTIDLFTRGFQEEDFSNNIFQLEIEDFSLDFSGSVTDFQIRLFHHSIPLGFQFRGIIPATTVDTEVNCCITLTDTILNWENSTSFKYYADALAPEINVTPIISPLDLLNNSYFIEVSANVTDKGGILDVYLYYKFALEDEWTITDMNLMTGDLYSGKIILNSQLGDAFFKIRAFDLISHSAETNVSQISFSHAFYPIITIGNAPFADPLDMNESKILTVYANIIDKGIITSVILFYRFASDEEWIQLTLEYDTEAGYYFGDIELSKKKGSLQFKLRATDDANFTAETGVYTVNYINAGTAVNPAWYIVPSAVGGVALIGGATFFVVKKRRRWGKK